MNDIEKVISDGVGSEELESKLAGFHMRACEAMAAKNWGYAIALNQAILKETPGFLEGRKQARLAAVRQTEGKRLKKLNSDAIRVLQMRSLVESDPRRVMIDVESGVLAHDPYHAQANELLFEAADAAGLPLTAAFALETVVEGEPDNLSCLHKLGDFHMRMKSYDEAVRAFSRIVEKDRSDLDAAKKYKNATAMATMENSGLSRGASFREMIVDPGEFAQRELSEKEGATPEMMQRQVDALLVSLADDENNAEVNLRLAELYEKLDQGESALICFERVLSINPGDVSLEKHASRLRDQVAESHIQELRGFVSENPTHPDIERIKCELEEAERSRVSQFIGELQDRISRNPSDLESRFELGAKLLQSGEYRDAIRNLQKARKRPNLRIQSMNLIAQCYSHMGMRDLAVRQFEKAISEIADMNETKMELLYHVGLIYADLGELDKYLDALKDIYEEEYDYKDVAERVEKSYGG